MEMGFFVFCCCLCFFACFGSLAYNVNMLIHCVQARGSLKDEVKPLTGNISTLAVSC